MKLSEIKNILNNLQELHFQLEDGTAVPKHFHVTEVGQINKKTLLAMILGKLCNL